jgi:osmotically-inducible protein OsmY
MKGVIILLLLVALAVGAYLFFANPKHSDQLQRAEEQVSRRAEQMTETVKDKLKDWSLSTTNIQQELERTGKVVRKKAQEIGTAIADATADARTTAAIKAKLVKDPDLFALSVSVNTTEGVVTLSGSVSSPEQIRKAMELALETEGVREVISTIQTKAAAKR